MREKLPPVQYRHYLPTRFYTELPVLVLGLELDLKNILEDTGLNEQQLRDASTEKAQTITREPSEKLLLNLFALANNPALGFIFGEKYHFSSHGAVGFAALTCENIAEALNVAEKYFPVLTPLFELKTPDGSGINNKEKWSVIEIQSKAVMRPDIERFLVEAMLANLHVMAQFMYGNSLPAYTIELTYPLQQHHFDYADQHGISIVGNQKQTRVVIPTEVLNLPLPLADKLALQKHLKECDELLALIQSTQPSLSQVIANRLNQEGSLFLSQEVVANELNMGSRTLHRQLSKEGISFREIANRVRISQAKQLLVESEYSISQVAHELGYTDAANFTRAFKKVEGVSPSEYRAAN